MDIPQTDVQEAARRVEDGTAVLVDVREPHETAIDHAATALLNPMSAFDLAALPDDGRDVLLICRSGARSQSVAQALAERGIRTENVAGGTDAWRAAGLPMA